MKEKLLDSAVGTFRRLGIRGASVSEIAADASVPVGSVYNHFASKEDLAIAVLRRYAMDTDMTMLSGAGSARKRLRDHIETQIARTRGTGLGHGCMLANFAGELSDTSYPRLREEVRKALRQWGAALGDVVRQGQASGEITSQRDPDELGDWLVTSLEGATTQAKTLGDTAPLDTFVSIAFDAVLA